MEQELLIVIPIDHGNDLPDSFTSTAKIVRVENGLMAVQFLDLDEDQKTQLHNWFAYEIRQKETHAE